MSKKLCIMLVAVATAAAAATAAPSLAGTAVGATASVTVGDNVFAPRSTTLRRNGRVRWIWRGRRRHNVVFASGSLGAPRTCGARRSGDCVRRFRRRGSFGYVCTFHGSMAGMVRVRR